MNSSTSSLTESIFYILLTLQEPMHGYGIMQRTSAMSKGRLILSAGTVYGAFENGDNVASKLRLANKAFNHYFNRLTGLLYMGVFCLLLLPLLRLLPECWFSRLLIGICSDFPIVCLIVATAMLYPVVMKIRRKMNCLIRKLF